MLRASGLADEDFKKASSGRGKYLDEIGPCTITSGNSHSM